jgi:hypothetical protein
MAVGNGRDPLLIRSSGLRDKGGENASPSQFSLGQTFLKEPRRGEEAVLEKDGHTFFSFSPLRPLSL